MIHIRKNDRSSVGVLSLLYALFFYFFHRQLIAATGPSPRTFYFHKIIIEHAFKSSVAVLPLKPEDQIFSRCLPYIFIMMATAGLEPMPHQVLARLIVTPPHFVTNDHHTLNPAELLMVHRHKVAAVKPLERIP